MIMKIIYLVSFMDIARTFLLHTNSSFTSVNSKEFDQLLDLIVEEKKSRLQLEQYVGILQNRYLKLEASFQNLTGVNAAIGVKNKDLEVSVHNLTLENLAILAKNKDLEASVHNLTLQNIDIRAENSAIKNSSAALTRKIDEANKRIVNLDQNIALLNLSANGGQTTDQGNATANLTRKLDETKKRIEHLDQNLALMNLSTKAKLGLLDQQFFNQSIQISSVTSKFTNITRAIEDMKKNSGINIGFTTTDPDISLAENKTTILKFKRYTYDFTDSYNMTTGKFVCKQPGMYLFIATIVRSTAVKHAYCYICLNGVRQAAAVAYADDITSSYPSGSTSLVTHLDVGDEVYLSYCEGIHSLDVNSYFSGVFIHPSIV